MLLLFAKYCGGSPTLGVHVQDQTEACCLPFLIDGRASLGQNFCVFNDDPPSAYGHSYNDNPTLSQRGGKLVNLYSSGNLQRYEAENDAPTHNGHGNDYIKNPVTADYDVTLVGGPQFLALVPGDVTDRADSGVALDNVQLSANKISNYDSQDALLHLKSPGTVKVTQPHSTRQNDMGRTKDVFWHESNFTPGGLSSSPAPESLDCPSIQPRQLPCHGDNHDVTKSRAHNGADNRHQDVHQADVSTPDCTTHTTHPGGRTSNDLPPCKIQLGEGNIADLSYFIPRLDPAAVEEHRQRIAAFWPHTTQQANEQFPSFCKLYQQVKSFNLPNVLGARITLNSALNLTAWEDMLREYHD